MARCETRPATATAPGVLSAEASVGGMAGGYGCLPITYSPLIGRALNGEGRIYKAADTGRCQALRFWVRQRHPGGRLLSTAKGLIS